MHKDMESRNVGRCLTEYKHKEFDKVVAKAEGFFKISQFSNVPTSLEGLDIDREGDKCSPSYGERMFAIVGGDIIEILSIIDSSD